MSVSTRFEGMERLLGVEAANMVGSSHVCIVGIGGVGSWTAEALARSGIGAITLVDLDDVCVSNTNRQIHALQSTVGQFKVDVMAARIREINPNCTVHTICDFFRATNADDMLDRGFDVVVDAIGEVLSVACTSGSEGDGWQVEEHEGRDDEIFSLKVTVELQEGVHYTRNESNGERMVVTPESTMMNGDDAVFMHPPAAVSIINYLIFFHWIIY